MQSPTRRIAGIFSRDIVLFWYAWFLAFLYILSAQIHGNWYGIAVIVGRADSSMMVPHGRSGPPGYGADGGHILT